MAENKMDSAANNLDLESLMVSIEDYKKHPWDLCKEPFQMSDNVWYVGNQFVGCYLIDTGAGLVLIDTAFRETVPLLAHSIHLTGHNTADIKYIFLSHAHVDHCGGARYMQALAARDVRTFLGQDDMFFLTERRDLILDENNDVFEAEPYDYTHPMQIGNTCFNFIHTPGHTPGCTTFCFNTTVQGEPIRAAMHGGLGVLLVAYKILEKNRLPKELHEQYLAQLENCKKMDVDMVIPSHNKDWNVFALQEQDDGTHRCFINREAWAQVMDKKAAALIKCDAKMENK